jgi:hypothetical protein
MSKVRLVLIGDDELRATLRLEAARRETDMSTIMKELIETHLASTLAEVRARRKEAAKKGKPRADS